MILRLSDIIVGVIAGAVCSVLAAGFEAFIVAFRFISVGHVGGGIGSKIVLIALMGAIVGGIVGWAVGAIVKTRERGPA